MPCIPAAPRQRRQPPAYRRHSTGQAFVEIRGRRYYLGAWSKYRAAPSWAAYERKIAELWAKPPQPAPELELTPGQVDRLTVADLLLAYRRFAEKEYSRDGQPTAFLANLASAMRRLADNYGATSARDFGPLKIRALRETWIKDRKARKTVNEYANAVRRVFKFAVEHQLVPSGVLEGLKAVSGVKRGRLGARETAPIEPVADEVIDATLAHLPPMVADMVRLQRLTGWRPCELCIMRRCDITRGESRHAGKRGRALPLLEAEVWEYLPATQKTSHLEHEPPKYIGPRGQMILRRYMLGDADGYCFSPAESERQRRAALHASRQIELNFGNSPGTNRKVEPARKPGPHYTTASYRRAIHRACEIAFNMPPHLRESGLRAAKLQLGKYLLPGGPPLGELERIAAVEREARGWYDAHAWNPNQIRHTVGTERRSTHGLEGAQVSLGHKHLNTTEIYALADAEKLKAIAREVG